MAHIRGEDNEDEETAHRCHPDPVEVILGQDADEAGGGNVQNASGLVTVTSAEDGRVATENTGFSMFRTAPMTCEGDTIDVDVTAGIVH